MNVLFFSDLHLPLGPREPIRPEMRRLTRRFGTTGRDFMDRFEDRLRIEAKKVELLARTWIQRNADDFDLLINGGDNALPLSRHEDRLDAARTVWTEHVKRFGEHRYIALTGNHELGHGYHPDPSSYADLMNLREEIFHEEINRRGYGLLELEGTHFLFLDSELMLLSQRSPKNPLILENSRLMADAVREAIHSDKPIAIITHNTTRTRRWIRSLGLWADLVGNGRQIVLVGGHYHVPRAVYKDGAEVHWSGGGSYPEPWLRYLSRLPFTGIKPGGPGSVELVISEERIRVQHLPFGVPMGLFRRAAA